MNKSNMPYFICVYVDTNRVRFMESGKNIIFHQSFHSNMFLSDPDIS